MQHTLRDNWLRTIFPNKKPLFEDVAKALGVPLKFVNGIPLLRDAYEIASDYFDSRVLKVIDVK